MVKQIHYRLKIMLQKKSILFWTLGFPLILSVFFNVALKGIYDNPKLVKTNVGVVVSDVHVADLIDQLEDQYQLVVQAPYESIEQAKQALKEGKIDAIIDDQDQVRLTFTKESYNSQTTVLSNVFKSYNMKRNLINEQLAKDPTKLTPQFVSSITQVEKYVKTENNQASNQTYIIHFYTAIAMLCIYASEWGNASGKYLQADMSSIGIRNNISPTKKSVLLLQDLFSIYVIFIVEFSIALLFMKYVLEVPFGENVGLIIGTGLIGGLLTSMIGYMICVLIKGKESVRSSVISGVGVFMSFLSGMMASGIKFYIDVYFPLLSKINPAALITDNFYWIYMNSHYEVIYMNMMIMLLMTLICGLVAYFRMKGVTYEHI